MKRQGLYDRENQEKEQEIKEHENQFIDFFDVLAGILAGFGSLLVVRRKK